MEGNVTEDKAKGKEKMHEASSSHSKKNKNWELIKCIPKAPKIPNFVVNSERYEAYTEYMKKHAFIEKFLRLWPSKRDMIRWIGSWWNLKGQYELRLR